MPNGKKKKGHKMATHKRKKRLRKNRHKSKLSGVEPHYLKKAFDAFKVGGHCSNAELVIEIQDIIVRCCQCGREGTIMANEFVCPMCGSRELVVIKGEDLILMRLELEK